jgi:sortase B
VYLLVIALGIALFVFTIMHNAAKSKSAESSSMAVISPFVTTSPSSSPVPSVPRDDALANAAKQSAKKNNDVIGWIRIEGTRVNYPVVQTRDNIYYLTHDVDNKTSKRGAIYLDYRCDPQTLLGNNILYGHHMKDGSMFASVVEYKSRNYLNKYPVIEYATLEQTYYWDIFAVFITTTSYDYLKTEFSDSIVYLAFIKELQSKSMHKTGIELKASDKILILSTCTYEYDDARFVVVARRKE